MPEIENLNIHIPSIQWDDWMPLLGAFFAPNSSGVYEFGLDNGSKLLYVGKATCLKTRINCHISGSDKNDVLDQIYSTGIQPEVIEVRWAMNNYPAAVEEKLLEIHSPPFNKHGNWERKGTINLLRSLFKSFRSRKRK